MGKGRGEANGQSDGLSEQLVHPGHHVCNDAYAASTEYHYPKERWIQHGLRPRTVAFIILPASSDGSIVATRERNNKHTGS